MHSTHSTINQPQYLSSAYPGQCSWSCSSGPRPCPAAFPTRCIPNPHRNSIYSADPVSVPACSSCRCQQSINSIHRVHASALVASATAPFAYQGVCPTAHRPCSQGPTCMLADDTARYGGELPPAIATIVHRDWVHSSAVHGQVRRGAAASASTVFNACKGSELQGLAKRRVTSSALPLPTACMGNTLPDSGLPTARQRCSQSAWERQAQPCPESRNRQRIGARLSSHLQ